MLQLRLPLLVARSISLAVLFSISLGLFVSTAVKRVIAVLFFLCVSADALASMSGLYFGMEAGYGTGNIQKNLSGTIYPGGGIPPQDLTAARTTIDSQISGAVAGVYFGYSFVDDRRYLGVEFKADVTSASQCSSQVNSLYLGDVSGSVCEKIRGSLSLSLLPGIYFSDSGMVYLRLGFIVSDFATNSGAPNGQPDSGYLGPTGNLDEAAWGGIFGVGIEEQITPVMSFRVEYDRTEYWNFNLTGSSTPSGNAQGIGTEVVKSNYDLSNNQVMVGILFHLDGWQYNS